MHIDRKLYSIDTQQLEQKAKSKAFLVDAGIATQAGSAIAGIAGMALGEAHIAGLVGILGVMVVSKYVYLNSFVENCEINKILEIRDSPRIQSRTERFFKKVFGINFAD